MVLEYNKSVIRSTSKCKIKKKSKNQKSNKRFYPYRIQNYKTIYNYKNEHVI